jgi:hypothetical protein
MEAAAERELASRFDGFFDGFDEPAESSGRGMRKLVSDLGLDRCPDPDWADLVVAAVDAGAARLLTRLEHADPEVRRMVTHALEWCWNDARQIVPVLLDRLVVEPDPSTRVGILLAVAHLIATLPPGAGERTALERELTANLERAEPVLRFGAALGWVEHLLKPGDPVPAGVMDALAATVETGGPAYEALWGDGWDFALHAAVSALHGRPADQLSLLLRTSEQPQLPRGFTVQAGTVLSDSFTRDGQRRNGHERVTPLIEVLGRLAANTDEPTPERVEAARHLANLPESAARPAADMLATLLADPVADLREYAAHALARAGDHRCVPALREIIGRDQLPLGIEHLVSGMRAHAAELLPTVARRLAAVPPVEVIFLAGRRTTVRGGLRHYEDGLVSGVASWGRDAISLAPELRRILGLYQAEQARCGDRLPPDYYPLAHAVALLRGTLPGSPRSAPPPAE